MKTLSPEEMLNLHTLAYHYLLEYPSQRVGQAYMEVLRIQHPEQEETLLGTQFDPYFRDRILPSFFLALTDPTHTL